MPILIRVITRPPFQQVQRKMKAAQKKLQDQQRESMRVMGRALVSQIQAEAPKRSGKFAKGHTFKTFERGQAIELKIYFPKPLGDYIRFGTRAHAIAAKNAKALYFFWPKTGTAVVVPKTGGFKTHMAGGKLWIGKGAVWHPGTKANDYAARALARWRPRAVVELRKMGRAFVIGLED